MVLNLIYLFFDKWFFYFRFWLFGDQNLLDGSHESAKNKSCKVHKHQCSGDSEVKVLSAVATFTIRLSADLNLEYESEGNSSSDHTGIRNEQQFIKFDCLLLEAKSETVECSEHTHDPSTEDDGKLNEYEAPWPPSWNGRVQWETHIWVDCSLEHLSEETEWQGGSGSPLWW